MAKKPRQDDQGPGDNPPDQSSAVESFAKNASDGGEQTLPKIDDKNKAVGKTAAKKFGVGDKTLVLDRNINLTLKPGEIVELTKGVNMVSDEVLEHQYIKNLLAEMKRRSQNKKMARSRP